MSEYMEKHSVARLIGAPPGYVGYEEGGQLTEMVRRRPYAVVLFDEFEKAHPDVHNVLLQILDEGRLTDGKGRVVNFKNAIIIMTSNIAGALIRELEQGSEPIVPKVNEILRAHFRPEFLNRIDEIVIFRSLDRDALASIVEIQVKRLQSLLAGRQIGLELTRRAKDLIARQGYDRDFGARPMKRAIQRQVQDPLALKILEGEIAAGDTVAVDADATGDKILFETRKAANAGTPVP